MKCFFAVVCAATLALASATSEIIYTNGWVKSAHPVHDSTPVSFTIVVQEQGEKEIERIAREVSDPAHASYGQYLTQAQLDDIVRPKSEDVETVLTWLRENGMSYRQRGVSNVVVAASAGLASQLFGTKFHMISNNKYGQAVVRATDYELPAGVEAAVKTIFGLHGLPVPPKTLTLAPPHRPKSPANVTPAVIYSTYSVTPPKVSRSEKNKQAVAEFQGQFMNSTDLATMFKKYVTGYQVGVDDVVDTWFGKHIENSGGVEAELDIQYIMGVSVGIKTEFFEFPGNDFGADLNMWTSNLTSMDNTPLVHSVSYGWQGNLSQIHVKQADVDVIDGNLAKLATKGISIMISSGDSGSGYAEDNQCQGPAGAGQKGVGIAGTVLKTMAVEEVGQCCFEAGEMKAEGWTFVPHAKKPDAAPAVTAARRLEEGGGKGFKFTDAVFHDQSECPDPESCVFKTRDVFTLNGEITEDGGSVKVVNANGTVGDSTITFGPAGKSAQGPETVRNITGTFGGVDLKGHADFIKFGTQPEQCFILQWECPEDSHAPPGMFCYMWEHGPNPPPPPPPGTCTLYKTVDSHTQANETTFSDFKKKAAAPPLWASWPASSPWVTAVGATRFVGQTVGNEEMATDQFGSGGGFSKMFDQTNAQWQAAMIKTYLSTAPGLPPATSYDANGRGTPDVAALGEGYQVIVGGHPTSVGGTSASSPCFAGLVSLLNEARLNAGKPAMGFLNPFLYKNADAFTDIVTGSNKIGRGGNKLPYGWNCTKGWDPATGLGTPKFDKLMAAAMK